MPEILMVISDQKPIARAHLARYKAFKDIPVPHQLLPKKFRMEKRDDHISINL